MKREEREYEEAVPEATRKARLEQQAANLMSLPLEIREMVMLKMSPVDMYMLYKAVNNQEFRQWCDEYFWNYAISQLFPGFVVPKYMTVYPRHMFLAYVAEKEMFDRNTNEEFRDTNHELPDVNFEYDLAMEDDNRVTFAMEISSLYIDEHDDERLRISLIFRTFMATLPSASDAYFGVFHRYGNYSAEMRGSIEYIRNFVREHLFYLFREGYFWRFLFDRDGPDLYRPIYTKIPFAIGCHICGSPEVTGYSAEDPSKLLCGPGCVGKN